MSVPKCLAIIPDGNRRAAALLGLPAIAGHTRGLATIRTIVEAAFKRGIEHVVVWGTSTLNLRERSPLEIKHILGLFKEELIRLSSDTAESRLHICGDWREFTDDRELFQLTDEAQQKSLAGSKHHLTILFGYGGRADLLAGINNFLASGGTVATEENFRRHLMTNHLPDVDLLIRTGGKAHWSDCFLPWQMFNAELVFSPRLWPSFGVTDLDEALADYATRRRKQGA